MMMYCGAPPLLVTAAQRLCARAELRVLCWMSEDEYAGVRERVVNPIGIKSSKLSVTLLGHYEQGAAERVARQQKQIEDQQRDFRVALDQSKRVR